MKTSPRKIVTPCPELTLKIPEGMSKTEFYNSNANLKNLAEENGLFRTPEDLLMYRKLVGHSTEFDTSVILDTSRRILDPLGRPVRRDQMRQQEKKVWSKMTQIICEYMFEKYPDPAEHLILCGEASLDSTWPLNKPGVPSIRMIHNHFLVFPMELLRNGKEADANNPNLTDSGHNTLFLRQLSDAYRQFLEVLDLQILKLLPPEEAALELTGYPQGLPCWEVPGGIESLNDRYFWHEYEQVLRGFLDFYRTFFTLVSSCETRVLDGINFPHQVDDVLLGNQHFVRVAQDLREKVIQNPQFANDIRWRPAYKQILFRDSKGRLIVTISQNSVGNAITELLGIVVQRQVDPEAYAAVEEGLVNRLLEVRERLQAAGLGESLSAPCWPNGHFQPCR